MAQDGCDTSKLDDIAEQLVHNIESKHFKVILGGGRAGFRNQTVKDEEGKNGYRTDGRDLIQEWKTERNKMGQATYIFDRNGLRNLDFEKTDYVLGLFEHDHMKYNLDVINQNLQHQEPTLTEMTVAAIKMLQKEKNGFFLFVEGGMIDQAHHYNYAKTSLDETKEFSRAVEAARQMTDEEETLIVVTADHSHVFTYNGYPERGSHIFGSPEVSDEDGKPYSTLSYANGPGYAGTYNPDGSRVNPETYDTSNPKLQFPATVPRDKDTHGGEDVGVWASGPMAHLFRGSYEQNSIPMIMAYILQVGPYAVDETCASCSFGPMLLLLAAMLVMLKIVK
jgi:alkaline phosphatase